MPTTIVSKYTVEPSKRANGKPKWVITKVVEELVVRRVVLDKKEHIMYIRKSHEGKPYAPLYWEDGSNVMGSWQHGNYGSKNHIERVEWCDEPGRRNIISGGTYMSGQRRSGGQRKHLRGVYDQNQQDFLK